MVVIYLLYQRQIYSVLRHIEEMNPAFVVIDSIQTIHLPEVTSAPGSVAQVRECTAELMKLAKQRESQFSS